MNKDSVVLPLCSLEPPLMQSPPLMGISVLSFPALLQWAQCYTDVVGAVLYCCSGRSAIYTDVVAIY